MSCDEHELLCDHAHCELRAAASAQGLVTHNPEASELVDCLLRLAQEELRHFRQVVDLLRELGGELHRMQGNPYADGLLKKSLPSRGSVLLDRLLISGLIEERSHERFALLAEHAAAPQLRALFTELMPSEAGHARLFERLALELLPRDKVERRAAELVSIEAEVMSGLEFSIRMHSGTVGLE